MGANAQVALEKFARYFDVEARMVPVDESTNYVLDPERAMQYVDEVSVPGCLLRLPQKTTLIFSSPSLQNTIGVFVILGSTYTGTYESVEGMSKKLDEYEAKTGIFVPVRFTKPPKSADVRSSAALLFTQIHVDAASGGFFCPFATPSHLWDFKLPRVVSINASGHKYGRTYVGCGIIVWRDKKHLPKDLVFTLTYLVSRRDDELLQF